MSDLKFTSHQIWSACPITRTEMRLILKAPGFDHFAKPEPMEGTYETTLALIALLGVQLATRNDEPSKKQVERLMSAFNKFRVLMAEMDFRLGAPPAMPESWETEMVQWAQQDRKSGKGPRIDARQKFIIKGLLSFYEYAFERRVSHTANGPTVRFVRAYMTVFALRMKEISFVSIGENAGQPLPMGLQKALPNLKTVYEVGSESQIEKQIRMFEGETHPAMIGDFVKAICENGPIPSE